MRPELGCQNLKAENLESGSLMAKSLPKETLAFGLNYLVCSAALFHSDAATHVCLAGSPLMLVISFAKEQCQNPGVSKVLPQAKKI